MVQLSRICVSIESANFFKIQVIFQRIYKYYNNLLIIACILLSGISEILLYLNRIDGFDQQDFQKSSNCANTQSTQEKEKDQVIRVSILGCLLLFMILNIIYLRYINDQSTQKPYIDIIIIFFIVESFFQQVVNYQRELWVLMYLFYIQKTLTQNEGFKVVIIISILFSIAYVILRLFLYYGFKGELLIFTIGLLVYTIFSLCFSLQFSQIQAQLKYPNSLPVQMKQQVSGKKGIGSSNKEYSNQKLTGQKNLICFNSKEQQQNPTFQVQDTATKTFELKKKSSFHQNDCQHLQPLSNQLFSKQNSNENIVSIAENTYCKLMTKSKHDPHKPLLSQEVDNFELLEFQEISFAWHLFYHTSLQGIAIIDTKSKLIFENQQLSYMLNGFEKKSSTAETILNIKLIKNNSTKGSHVASQDKHKIGDDNQQEVILESNSLGQGKNSSDLQRAPNNLIVKKSPWMYFQQPTQNCSESTELKQEQNKIPIGIVINNLSTTQNNQTAEFKKQFSKQYTDGTNEGINSSNVVTGIVIAPGSTSCDKVNNNENNECQKDQYQQISPNILGLLNNNQKKFTFVNSSPNQNSNNNNNNNNINNNNINNNCEYSNILQESFNNTSINQQFISLHIDKENKRRMSNNLHQGSIIQTPISSNQNLISGKNSFIFKDIIQNSGNNVSPQYHFTYKKKEGFRTNQQLLELLKSNSNCTIKDILNILLDLNTYIKQNNDINQLTRKSLVKKNFQNDQVLKNPGSFQDSYASYSPRNSHYNQSSIQKFSYHLGKKGEQLPFDIIIDDQTVLIIVDSEQQKMSTTIKISVISQIVNLKDTTQIQQENLYAFLEFSLQNQEHFAESKQQTEKLEENKLKIEHFKSAFSWFEQKLRKVMDPCISRISIYKLYQKHGCQNLSKKEFIKLFLTPIMNSVSMFSNTVQNVTDYQQILEGNFELDISQFSLAEMFHDCLNIFQQQAIFQNISLELKMQKNIRYIIATDYIRLKQLLLNLISNAVKHTIQGSVVVSIIYDTSESLYKISVQDTGVGISREMYKKIFQVFNQNISGNKSDLGKIFITPDLGIQNSVLQSKVLNSNLQNANNLLNFSTFTQSYVGAGSVKEDNYLGNCFNLQISNFYAQRLGGNRPITLNSELGVGSMFSFYVKDYSLPKENRSSLLNQNNLDQIQTIYQTKPNQQNVFNCKLSSADKQSSNDNQEPNLQIDNESVQEMTSLCKNVNEKRDEISYPTNNKINEIKMKNMSQQYLDKICQTSKIEKTPSSDNHITGGSPFLNKVKRNSSDSNKLHTVNSKLVQQNIIKENMHSPQISKRRIYSQKSIRSLNNDNLIYDESCNIYSDKASQFTALKKPPHQNLVKVTNKRKEQIYSFEDTSPDTSRKNKQSNSQLLHRRCKTLSPMEIEEYNSQQNQCDDFDVFYFGAVSKGGEQQTIRTKQKSLFYTEQNSDVQNMLQPQNYNNQQNVLNQQKYPTTFYQCDNPMQSTISNQNDSFLNVSPSLNNFFTPGKSQNMILYNNPLQKGSPRNKIDSGEISKNGESMTKVKSPYKKQYSVRQVNSEFVQSDHRSLAQKSFEMCEKEEIQRFLVQDSPLFIQSFNAFKGMNNPDDQLHMIKKVQTEFTQQNSTIFQGSPRSLISMKGRNTHRNDRNTKFNQKKKQCNCPTILIVEQTENNLIPIKEKLTQLKLSADISLGNKDAREKVMNRMHNSICCPKYKLIFIDIEFSEDKGIKTAKDITNICSVNTMMQQPFICSCAPNLMPSNQILYGEGFDVFDYCLYKPIDNEQLQDVFNAAFM